jgi:hypothetical protein
MCFFSHWAWNNTCNTIQYNDLDYVHICHWNASTARLSSTLGTLRCLQSQRAGDLMCSSGHHWGVIWLISSLYSDCYSDCALATYFYSLEGARTIVNEYAGLLWGQSFFNSSTSLATRLYDPMTCMELLVSRQLFASLIPKRRWSKSWTQTLGLCMSPWRATASFSRLFPLGA